MKNFFICFSTFLFFSLPAFSQFQNIIISTFNTADPFDFVGEESICIDPTNQDRMTVCINHNFCYYSSDGGQTWTNSNMVYNSNVFDPCVIADTNGVFYYFKIDPICGNEFCVYQSINYGQTWNYVSSTNFSTVTLAAGDKEYACIDPLTNIIHITFSVMGSDNVYYSKSIDAGLTWSIPTQVTAQSGNLQSWSYCASGSSGDIYTTWRSDTAIFFQRSSDGGNTWLSQNIKVDTVSTYLTTNFYNSPSIACDKSGGLYNGNIYTAWQTELSTSSENFDIYFAKSTDNGTSWIISSIDNSPAYNSFNPWVCIDDVTGNIYISYSKQNISSGQYDVMLAYSTDGGGTFTNVQISNTPASVPQGHYSNCAAYNNVIRPVWESQDTLWTALINYSQLSSVHPDRKTNLHLHIQPTIFNSSSVLTITSEITCDVAIRIFDVSGKIRGTISEKDQLSAGETKKIGVNADQFHLTSGVYYIGVITEQQNKFLKFIVVK